MALDIGELNGYLSLDIAGFTDNVKDAIGQLKSKDWKKAGLAAGALAGAALAAGFKSSMDLQSATAQTAAQLGLTEDQAAISGSVAGKLYSEGLGESMADVSNATGAVIASFDGMRNASEKDIELASKSALQFSKVMGVDVAEGARTAGVMVENKLAKDPAQAFDLLTAAAQKVGPDMVEPLMDATEEYSKHFGMIGMSGDDAMALLSEAASGGEIAIDKAGDAIKEFGIRATDLDDKGAQDALKALGLNGKDTANALLAGGEDAQKATQDIADALLKVEDPAEQAKLASGLFGTQIEDIGKDNLPGFLGAMGEAGEGMGDVAGKTAEAADTMSSTVGGKLKKFGRMVQTELMSLAEPAVDFLTPMLDGLSKLQRFIVPAVVALGAFATIVGIVNLATMAYNTALKIQKGYTAVATAAQWAWNAAMSANPIALVVIAIAALVGALVLFFTKTEIGQRIWSRVWGAIKAAAKAVADWFMNSALPLLQAAWNGIAAGALWLYRSAILPAWNGIKFAIQAVASWITGSLVPFLQAAWQTIATAAKWLYNSVIKPVWNGIKIAIVLVIAAVMTYIDIWMAIFRNVVAPVFRWLYNSVIKPVWNAIKAAISTVINWFKNTAVPFIKTAINIAKAAFENFKRGLQIIWRFIRNTIINPVFNWFKNTVVAGLSNAVARIRSKFDQFKLGLQIIWRFIKNTVIMPVYNWFKNTVVAGLSSAVARIRSKFDSMKNRLHDIWKNIKNTVINPVYRWFKNTVVGGLKAATDKIKDAFNTMKDAVGKAWDKVKSKAKAPIKFVVDTVINKGIVRNFNKIAGKFGVKKLPEVSAGFASGGVLPGYTPGRDVHSFYSPSMGRLDLSGGEAIMRPEFTRAVGGAGGVARLNKQAINGSLRTDAFASGGVWGGPRHAYAGGGALDWLKDKGGKAANWIQDKASWVADVVSDPLGTFKTFASGLLGGIPGAGLMVDMGKGVVNKVASGIGDFLKGKNESGAGPAAGNLGSGGSLGWASNVARRYGLTMTSGYRPGARTSSGSLSMHGLGRARDFSNSSGPTPQMMAFAKYMLANSHPTELLYSPLGSANLHRSGRQYANTGATLRGHYNHVHVAFKKGGVLEDMAGRGYASGTLNATPGWHMVGEEGPEMVRFRGGEKVKSTQDTEKYLGNNRSVTLNNHFHEVGGEAAEIAALRVQNRISRSAREAAGL